MITLLDFMVESNAIEGIYEEPSQADYDAMEEFLRHDELDISKVIALVKQLEPTACLRTQSGMNVRVGGYYPPSGGMHIMYRLQGLLDWINHGDITPWQAHVAYEKLHPFTDCNGRSGRAIWLWQQPSMPLLSFLHSFYYATLSEN